MFILNIWTKSLRRRNHDGHIALVRLDDRLALAAVKDDDGKIGRPLGTLALPLDNDIGLDHDECGSPMSSCDPVATNVLDDCTRLAQACLVAEKSARAQLEWVNQGHTCLLVACW